MSQTRENCGGERISGNTCSLVGAAGGTSRLVLATLGVVCMALVALATRTAPAAGVAAGAPASRGMSAAVLRQLRTGEGIYRIDNPVRLEETTVKVKLRSPDDMDWPWRFLGEIGGERPIEAVAPGVLEALKELGETTVLHGGVCLLSGREPVSVYSSKRVPVQTTRVSGGQPVSVVEYRDLGRKLTAHLEGIDAQGRLCFSYNIDLNYIEGEADSASPAFASFNAEGHAKVKDGETLVIPNFDGTNGLVVLLTPRIMK